MVDRLFKNPCCSSDNIWLVNKEDFNFFDKMSSNNLRTLAKQIGFKDARFAVLPLFFYTGAVFQSFGNLFVRIDCWNDDLSGLTREKGK